MANKIYIQIEAQSEGAEKTIDDLNKGIAQIGPNSEKSSQQANTAIKSVSTTIEQTASSMDRLAQVITGMGVANFAKDFVMLGDDLNRIRMGFENLSGGVAIFGQLQAIASKTGFDMKTLAEGAQTLVNAGMNVGTVAQKMQVLADQAAFAGKNADSLLNLTQKLAQISAKGFVSGRDIAAFAQIGVLPLDVLRDKFHLTMQSIREDMKLISSSEFIRQLFQLMQSRTAGAGAARAEQLPGAQFGVLTSQVQALAQSAETALTPALIAMSKALQGVVDIVADAVRYFSALPEPVKEVAIGLAGMAVAIKALNIAFGLWQGLLPLVARLWGPVSTAIESVWTVMKAAHVAIVTFDSAVPEMTAALAMVEMGFKSLMATLAPLLPLLLAAGAAWVAYKGWQEWVDTSDEVTKAMDKAFKDRAALAQQAQQLEDRLRQQGVKNIPSPGRSYQSMTIDQLKEQLAVLQDLGKKQDDLYQADQDKIRRAKEYGENLLAEAMKNYLKTGQESIEALTYAWQEHFKKTKESAIGTADAVKALEVAVSNEALKRIEAVNKEQQKAAQEHIAMQRKISIARLETVPDQGLPAQLQLQQEIFQDRAKQYREQADERIKEDQRVTDLQIAGANKALALELQMAKTPAAKLEAHLHTEQTIRDLEQAHRDYTKIQDQKVIDDTEYYRQETNKKTNAAIYEDEKKTRDELTQYEIDEINTVRDYRVAAITMVQAHTLKEQLGQITAVRDANIDAIEQVRQAQLDNAAAAREQYKKALEASGVLNPEQIRQRLENYDAEVSRQLKTLNLDTERQIQMQRIDAWKQGNEAIISQQRQVYESIQGFMGELFDAFLDKNKSIWSAIGDVIKRTLLNAIKSVVTSQAAAMLTGILGYGGVTFQQGPLGQQIPVFSGAGTPPIIPSAAGTGATTSPLGIASQVLGGLTGGFSPAGGYSAIGGYSSAGGVSTGGSAPVANEAYRMMDEGDAGTGVSGMGGTADVWSERVPGQSTTAGGTVGWAQRVAKMKDAFNIGKSVYVPGSAAAGTYGKWVPWSQATPAQKLGSVLKSQGMATMASSIGLPMLLSSLSQKGPKAAAMGIIGGAAAGYGLATTFLGSWMGPSGALAGAGIGLFAAGYKQRGVGGLAMTTVGGMLAGAGIGNMIMPGVGAVVGAAIGAGVGLVTGVVNLFRKSQTQQIRDLVRQVYGIDIPDQGVLQQISDIADQKYGGSIHRAVYGSDVQDLIRLYGLSTGQRLGALPRPMYSATYNQSASGGLQLQPVYSGGRVVANPYTGTTTTQLANWNTMSQNLPAVFLQLNPQQAVSLFQGQVVQAIGANPGAVAAANTTAAQSGQGRQTQAGSLLEPATVMS
jgi:hypothetical protein